MEVSDSRTMQIQEETAETAPTADPPKPTINKKIKQQDHQANWLEKTRGNLMIVATVIASMAFQAAVSPPDELWKEDSQKKECSFGKMKEAMINKKIIQARNLAINCINKYNSQEFIICNTVSFSASLSIIFLLTVLPLRSKISMWILLVAMCITVIFVAATYIISISLSGGGSKQERFNNEILLYYVVFWVCFLVIIVLFLVLQLLFWIFKKLAIGLFYAIRLFFFRKGKHQQKLKVIEPSAARV